MNFKKWSVKKFIRTFLTGLIISLVFLQAGPVYAYLPFLESETAVPVERGKSRLDVSFQHNQFRGNPSYGLEALRVELAYGIINNMDFAVDSAYRIRRVRGAEDEDGLGDLKLKVKVRFIKGREASPASIAGQMTVKFPSCNQNKDLSTECTGGPDVGIRAIATKEFFPVTAHLNLGYIFVGNPPSGELDDVFHYSLGLDYLTAADYFHIVGELAGETNRDPRESSDLLTALIGLVYDIDVDKVLTLSGSLGLTESSPDYVFLGGFRYLF